MAGDKTEKPTAKRIKDARKKGQVARSRDLAMAAALVAGTFALARLGGRLVQSLGDRLVTDLSHFGDDPLRTLTGAQIDGVVILGAQAIGVLVGPIALVTIAATVGVHGFQGGWNFAPEALHLNWSRLSPANGIKRFSPAQSGPETLKSLFSVAVVVFIGWGVTQAILGDSLRLAWLAPSASGMVAWQHAETLLWRIGWALAFLALGDYAWQRHRLMRSLRMSKQELRQEGREQEGDAQVKGRIRRIQRDLARRRMLDDVKKATVVVTNPTHFAVALEYRRDSMMAPRVLAKGRDHLAARIREEARRHEVPIVENKPLAQALYKTVEIGETIPAQLFAAVAEVLAYLVRIKQLML
jgi:flagellar biosynthetic protein FlhB